MPDPTGRWINEHQWQCPACGTVNGDINDGCENCGDSVRPSDEEPIRPVDVLDIIGSGQRMDPAEHAVASWRRRLPKSKWAGMAITHLRGRVKVFTRPGMVLVRVENVTGHAALTPEQADQLADDLHTFARMARDDRASYA